MRPKVAKHLAEQRKKAEARRSARAHARQDARRLRGEDIKKAPIQSPKPAPHPILIKCEIIVVKYGLPELETECLASIEEQTTGVDYKLTPHCNLEADEHLSKVWNDRIRESFAEYICLLNNDTKIVEDDWLSKLLESFNEIEGLGAVGPTTNSASGPQGNSGWRRRFASKKLVERGGPLVGFCMVFPRTVWEEVGGFDEEYALYGEDSDFCMELLNRGYKLAIRSDVFVFHHGKASTPVAMKKGKDIPSLITKSRERYRRKWQPNRK